MANLYLMGFTFIYVSLFTKARHAKIYSLRVKLYKVNGPKVL